VIEPLCGSESITLIRECQGFVNPLNADVCTVEPPEKTHQTEEIAATLILDGNFPQGQPLPGR